MKRWQIVLLCLVLAALAVLFFATYPSLGSIMIALIFLIIFVLLLWQKFLNR